MTSNTLAATATMATAARDTNTTIQGVVVVLGAPSVFCGAGSAPLGAATAGTGAGGEGVGVGSDPDGTPEVDAAGEYDRSQRKLEGHFCLSTALL